MDREHAYDEDYYERGTDLGISGYKNYRWLPELTGALARRLREHLPIAPGQRVLDFGCAKGFLVHALIDQGVSAYGLDLSEYAVEHGDPVVTGRLFVGDSALAVTMAALDGPFDWCIAKDVLEHQAYDALDEVIAHLRSAARGLFVAVPLGEGGRYVVPDYEHDVTHKIREPLQWWIRAFVRAGFTVERAQYLVPGIKDAWAHYPTGNGFIVAR